MFGHFKKKRDELRFYYSDTYLRARFHIILPFKSLLHELRVITQRTIETFIACGEKYMLTLHFVFIDVYERDAEL